MHPGRHHKFMIAQAYILGQLKNIKAATIPVIDFKSRQELVDFIYKEVMAKKFRKYRVAPDYQKHIYLAIETNVNNNEPIKFAFPFGAYKLWRLEESPLVDWAELFTLIYYSNWLKGVTACYRPGVWFDFSSDDVIVERINNIPSSDTKAYIDSFLALLAFLKPYLPDSLDFTLTKVGSRYTEAEFAAELLQKMEDMEKINTLSTLTDKQKRMIELNVKLKPGQDSDPRWREKVHLVHYAYLALSKRRPYYRTGDKIEVFTKAGDNYIAVGTTKTSVVKFWVGVGTLKRLNDGFIEYILSPAQLASSQFTWEQVSFDGLSGKNFNNFNKIRIIQ